MAGLLVGVDDRAAIELAQIQAVLMIGIRFLDYPRHEWRSGDS
jgi:hypothetical protein